MEIELRMIQDRVLVELCRNPDQTAGGVFVTDKARDFKVSRGVIRAIGAGLVLDHTGRRDPLIADVAVGDEILFDVYAGSVITSIDGYDDLIVIRMPDVYAIVEAGLSNPH